MGTATTISLFPAMFTFGEFTIGAHAQLGPDRDQSILAMLEIGIDSHIASSQGRLYFFWFAKSLEDRHNLLPLTTNKVIKWTE